MRTKIIILLVVLLAVPLTACAQRHAPRPSVDAWSALRLLAHQPPGPARLEARALRDCLRRQGFNPPLTRPFYGSVENLPMPIDDSGAHGYGDRLPRGADQVEDPITRYARSLPAPNRAALAQTIDPKTSQTWYTTPDGRRVGSATSGCMAAAHIAAYGSVLDWLMIYYLPQDLNNEAADTYRDGRVQRAGQAYHACMSAAGYLARYPQDAIRTAQQWSTHAAYPTQVPEREIRLATADARCQASTHLTAAIDAAFEARSAGWLSRNATAVLRAAATLRSHSSRHPTAAAT